MFIVVHVLCCSTIIESNAVLWSLSYECLLLYHTVSSVGPLYTTCSSTSPCLATSSLCIGGLCMCPAGTYFPRDSTCGECCSLAKCSFTFACCIPVTVRAYFLRRHGCTCIQCTCHVVQWPEYLWWARVRLVTCVWSPMQCADKAPVCVRVASLRCVVIAVS